MTGVTTISDDSDDDIVGLPRLEPASVLTGQGRILVEALTRKSGNSQRAIAMYMEALRALARNDGPESLHVAAYELREFMNALPRALDLPVVPYDQMIAKVQSFVMAWKRKSTKSKCLKEGEWDGLIDGELRDLLASVTTLVSWVEKQIPSRRAEATSVLQKLAPTEHPFPSVLMEMRTAEWSEMLKYFNNHAHHNSDLNPVEFRQRVMRLESFLLEHLEPRTFEDQNEIDRLILEVEGL